MDEQEEVALSPEIEQYKKSHRFVHSIEVLGREYIFRPITIGEFEYINGYDIPEEDKDDMITDLCLLNCQLSKDEYAGVSTTIAAAILSISGYDQEASVEALTYYRECLMSFECQMKAIVMEAFHITLDEIDKWNLNRLFEHYAYAEFMIEGLRGIPLSEILDSLQKQEPQEGLLKGDKSDFPEIF